MPLSRSRDYLSIGEVLDSLREEFPDVSISKIRFLESEGLINPERTPSGYRKFFLDSDTTTVGRHPVGDFFLATLAATGGPAEIRGARPFKLPASGSLNGT